MRILMFLALAVLAPACGNDPGQGADDDLGMSTDDLAVPPSGDLAQSAADLLGANDDGSVTANDDGGVTPSDAGVAGASCATACDCTPGLGCFAGKCSATNAPVYCCGSASCPSGHLCQATGGGYGQCGGGGSTPDLAGFDYCHLVSCAAGSPGTQTCVHAGCAMCVNTGNGMVCGK